MLFYVELVKNNHIRLTRYFKQQVQPLLKKQMKDIIAFSLDLDVNIHISMSKTTKKRLFNCAIRLIKWYLLIKPPKYAKSIFLWLVQLTSLNRLPTDLNRTKSKGHNENSKINNRVDLANGVDNKISLATRLLPINFSLPVDFNYNKSENCSDYYNISIKINDEVLLANRNRTISKNHSDNDKISENVVSEEILVMDDRQSNHCNPYLLQYNPLQE